MVTRLVGQALLPVRCDFSTTRVDRQECLSYQTPGSKQIPASGVSGRAFSSMSSWRHSQRELPFTDRDSGKIRAEKLCLIRSKLPPRFLPRTSHPSEKEFAPWNEAAQHSSMWM